MSEASILVSSKARQFQVGDMAVYPAHGVGRIVAIESRDINGKKTRFLHHESP